MSPSSTVRYALRRVPTRLGSLHVQLAGSGRPVVFWPSMFVDSDTWTALLPLLPDRQAILVDPPGLGRSDPLPRRTSIAEAADAAADLLAGLRRAGDLGDEPVDWVGNAFGGHVGFELGARSQLLGSLVAISAPPEPVPASLRRQIRVLHPLLRTLGPVGPVRSAIVDALLTDAAAADPAIAAVFDASLARPTRASLSRALQSFVLDRADVTDLLPHIDVPALFVAGDDRGDWSPEAARRAADLAPNATQITITGSRTLTPLEQPAKLADAIIRFWAPGRVPRRGC